MKGAVGPHAGGGGKGRQSPPPHPQPSYADLAGVTAREAAVS